MTVPYADPEKRRAMAREYCRRWRSHHPERASESNRQTLKRRRETLGDAVRAATRAWKAAHPLHRTWRSMMDRCYNPKDRCYHRYGGRGIAVCDRWREGWRAFADDMGPRPAGRSLDRIDNNGPYSPDNCRWATAKEQAANRVHRNQWTGRA